MEKLKMVIVSENTATNEMGGCGKQYHEFCGTRTCHVTGDSRGH